ncbi:hypothetical protein EVAR_36166_1 [Eumeta japonica]|uniref:C2H2-type domain-containing protein n=1 Tax=Eumeta variegata TaxID=151549 RepID=A0A4C1VRW7_EUMVA|nr:hypothetical protein EVAR_36166_1 [Eumeta japonica]
MLNQVPYARYCPSVEAYLFKRSCGICSLYFASYTAANQHKQSHKSQQEVVPIAKIRPQRIAARRARAVLCLSDDGDRYYILLTYSSDFEAARLDPCELCTVVPTNYTIPPYTYTLSERSAELHDCGPCILSLPRWSIADLELLKALIINVITSVDKWPIMLSNAQNACIGSPCKLVRSRQDVNLHKKIQSSMKIEMRL